MVLKDICHLTGKVYVIVYLFKQMFIVQCLFAKTEEAVGHHSRIVKSIFTEREHHIVPECFAQTGNLTHDCRCKYHTGSYFVIGINHEILLEIRVFQMNETGIIAFLQALDIFCQIADLLFQMVKRWKETAVKILLYWIYRRWH